jgi:hypothetical protein
MRANTLNFTSTLTLNSIFCLMPTMIDQTLINKWLDAKSDEALKKLLNNEPLSFEDNVSFCLVAQREETRLFRQEMERRFGEMERRFVHVDDEITDIKLEIRELKAQNMETNRRIDDLRKEMVHQTRWMLGGITMIVALAKLFDVLSK